LNGNPAHPQVPGDLVAVDPVAGAQLAGQDLVENVGDDLVLLFHPYFFGMFLSRS